MRLISCHIENFGKISDYDLHFDKGYNVICKRNGWGKSTLTAFLRVMLYGFVNESKRSELENERKRYKPWQGGVYGGSLVFEAGGKTYRCYRIFGDKEKEDQFRLLDDATNLETDDFSAKLGEELFQIDQDSFLKSACISQMGSDIRFVGATGSMNAKLGDLMGETGDISQFESVDKKLTDLLNQMSPRRATGSLYKQKKELEEYGFQITKKGKIEETIGEIRRKRQEEAERKERLEAERNQVNEKQKQLVVQEKRERYLQLLKERDLKREEYKSRRNCLPKELPDEIELDRTIKIAAEMGENHSAMQIYTLSEKEEQCLKVYEDKFSGCLPSQEEIDLTRDAVQTWRDNNRTLNELRVTEIDGRKLETYRSRFSDALPEEEELDRMIRNWEKRNQKKEALSTKKASLNMAKMMAQQAKETAVREAAAREAAAKRAEAEAAAKKSVNFGMGISILAELLMGTAGIFLLNKQLGIMGIILGVAIVGLIAGVAVISGRRSLARTKRSLYEAEETLPENADDFIDEEADREEGFNVMDAGNEGFDVMGTCDREDEAVRSLEREIREDEEFIYVTEEEIRRYLEIYEIDREKYRISDELHQMKNDVREYKNILAREMRYRQRERECDNDSVQRQIEEFLGRYDAPEVIAEGEYGELLQKLVGDAEKYGKLKEKRNHYERYNRAYKQQREELHRYLDQMSVEPEEDLYTQLQELQKQLGICIEKRKALRAADAALEEYEKKEDCRNFSDDAEEVSETAEELYERQNEISGQMKRVQDNIYAYNLQLEENEEKIERINEQESLVEELREIYEADLKKYERLTMTQKYLRIAKERLTEKYMAPLMNGFRKYYGILTGEEAGRYRMDANARLTVEEQGLLRQPELLSAGYRDITGLCMRMALIDAMYQGDAPFLLMDDPFVNYDGENLQGGMEFLKKASEKYQIIYFTCRKFETSS